MDDPIMTAQRLEERTAPDPASVAASVARAMRVRSGSKSKRLQAVPIHGGGTPAAARERSGSLVTRLASSANA